MGKHSDPDLALIDIPPTLQSVVLHAEKYRGTVHGDTSTGEIDVEFPTINVAALFAADMWAALGWKIEIREGDSVTSLNVPVVLTVFTEYTPVV